MCWKYGVLRTSHFYIDITDANQLRTIFDVLYEPGDYASFENLQVTMSQSKENFVVMTKYHKHSNGLHNGRKLVTDWSMATRFHCSEPQALVNAHRSPSSTYLQKNLTW